MKEKLFVLGFLAFITLIGILFFDGMRHTPGAQQVPMQWTPKMPPNKTSYSLDPYRVSDPCISVKRLPDGQHCGNCVTDDSGHAWMLTECEGIRP